MSTILEPLAVAGRNIEPKRCRSTIYKWLDRHPGLGLTIGGRRFVFVEARKAIARGVPLDEAERIGVACAERAQAGGREAA